jgi:hypothetical protein
MSFTAYLCWLLGISVSETCDPASYVGAIEGCIVEEVEETPPSTDGEKGVPPRHARGTNISVSI